MGRWLYDTRPDYKRIHPWNPVLAKRAEMIECDKDGKPLNTVDIPSGFTREMAMAMLNLNEEDLIRAKVPAPEPITPVVVSDSGPAVDMSEPDTVQPDAGQDTVPAADTVPPDAGETKGWTHPVGKSNVAHYNKAELHAYAKHLGLSFDKGMKNLEMVDKIREEEDRLREEERIRIEGK